MWLCSNSQWKWGVSNETLPTQSALFSWSVAHVEAVWEWWRRLHCSTSTSTWSQYHTPVIPLLLRKLQQMSLHTVTYEQSRDGYKVKADRRKKNHHLSHPLHTLQWENMPLPFVPPIFLYDQASSSLTSQEWCPRVGCGKENTCYFIKTARFKPCCQTCRFYE